MLPSYNILNSTKETIDILELTKGKVAFINFWFIPCPACFVEMSLLEELFLKYKDKNDFIFISITASNPEAVSNLLTKSYDDTSMYPFLKYFSKIDTVIFPIYYLQSCMDSVIKTPGGFYSFKIVPPEKVNCPYDIFKFSAYPTTIIVNKTGLISFQHTGILTSKKNKILKKIYDLIDTDLGIPN